MRDLLSLRFRRTTLFLWALWFVNTCAYYGVVMLTPSYFHIENEGSEYLDVFVTWYRPLSFLFLFPEI